MLTFLFWNVGGEAPLKTPAQAVLRRRTTLLSILQNLVRLHEVDLLILAECPFRQEDVLAAINRGNTRPFQKPDHRSLCPRITIYPRFAQNVWGVLPLPNQSIIPAATCSFPTLTPSC